MATGAATTEAHGAAGAAGAAAGTHHPDEAQYVKVALILAVITGVEVAVYYISGVRRLLVPILLVLSITKFSMVALWFMHLRFDSKLFRRLFVTGIVVAISVYAAALLSLHVLD